MSTTSEISFYLQQLNKHRSGDQPLICREELRDVDSPCLTQKSAIGLPTWQPIPHLSIQRLTSVEQALEMIIRPELHIFYGFQYSDHFEFSFKDYQITLLQLWNEEDFDILQKNLIAHLVTQRRLKLKPTLFIGTTQYNNKTLSVDNLTGEVIIEQLDQSTREVLSDSLILFLSKSLSILQTVS